MSVSYSFVLSFSPFKSHHAGPERPFSGRPDAPPTHHRASPARLVEPARTAAQPLVAVFTHHHLQPHSAKVGGNLQMRRCARRHVGAAATDLSRISVSFLRTMYHQMRANRQLNAITLVWIHPCITFLMVFFFWRAASHLAGALDQIPYASDPLCPGCLRAGCSVLPALLCQPVAPPFLFSGSISFSHPVHLSPFSTFEYPRVVRLL